MIFGRQPENWATASLGELLTVNPRSEKSQICDDTEVSFVPMPAVGAGSGSINVSETKKFSEVKKGYTAFLENDVLFAKITPCMENGKMAIVPKLVNDFGFGSTEFHVLRSPIGVVPSYIYYFVSSKHFRADAEHNMTGAVGQRRVPTNYLESAEIPLPPLNEQKRIVAKIEELFSELDNGIAALKTAREQLKVYRQAVLKHAFEGKLTAQWREDNKDKLEPPDQLLARIQQEREDRYQQQLENWKIAISEWDGLEKEGKSPPRPKQPKSITTNYSKLDDLPGHWRLVPLEALISFGPTNGWSPKAVSKKTNTKAITLTATTSGKFDGSQFKFIDAQIPKHSSLWLQPSDILVQRGNTIEYVGVPALYSGEDNEFIYPDLMMKIQTVDSVSERYLVHAMSLVSSRNFLRERAVGAAGSMPKINQQTLSNLPIPLCSTLEQKRLVELLEEKLSIIDSEIQEIEIQLSKSENLRQSILKKAFSGQLVPQDPNDEPASELLARIQAQKVAAQAIAKTTPKANSKKPAARHGRKKIESP